MKNQDFEKFLNEQMSILERQETLAALQLEYLRGICKLYELL